MINKDKLANGIIVVTEELPHLRSVALGVWLNKGSRDETEQLNGVSHFIEHILFKGTRKRSGLEIARTIDSIGGQLDGMTGRENICFYARLLDEHLPLAFDLLSDIVINPLFKKEDIESERKVILEEIKMVEDSPDELIHDLFIASFWQNHPLGRPVLGTREIVSKLSRKRMVKYFEKCFVPENIIISAAGHLKHKEVIKLAQKYFGCLQGVNGLLGSIAPKHKPSIMMVNRNELEQVHLCLGTTSYPINHPDRYAFHILNVLLGGGISSRLFQDIREKRGLAYSIYSFLNLYSDSGYLATYVGTSSRNLTTVIELIIKHIRDIIQGKIEPSELRLVKDHIKGQLMLSLESSATRMSKLAQQIIYFKRNFTLDEIIQGIEKVQLEDIQRTATAFFAGKQFSLTVLGDVKDKLISPQSLVP